MKATCGYYTPIGFHALDFIDLDEADQWMACATLDLMSADGFVIEGVPIACRDITPMIIVDANLDRMFNRETSGRCIDDREVYRR
jgi:hypothetical protein